MRYAEIAEVYLQPGSVPESQPSLPATPARRLRDALEPIATHGWWNRLTHERLEAQGVDFMEAYAWGRAAALGEPSAAVVVATFGVFEPTFLTGVYQQGRQKVGRDEVLAARDEGTVASLGAILDDVRREAGAVASTLLGAVDALDGSARPLFSGLRELSRPGDELGRLWRAAELVREHRGDGHLAACIAAGLDPVEMNVLTELWLGIPVGSYLATRGYGPDALTAALDRLGRRGLVSDRSFTARGRQARDAVEDATDTSQQDLVARLGDELDEIVGATNDWSRRVVEAGGFPPNPYKRAAG